jgi:hypothetical protein
LTQPNHLFPSLRSGIALTRLTLTLTRVSSLPHFVGCPPYAHSDVSIGLPLCAARGNCIPGGIRSSIVRGSHLAKERHDSQEGGSADQGVDKVFKGRQKRRCCHRSIGFKTQARESRFFFTILTVKASKNSEGG